jgi:hypothetical protein
LSRTYLKYKFFQEMLNLIYKHTYKMKEPLVNSYL